MTLFPICYHFLLKIYFTFAILQYKTKEILVHHTEHIGDKEGVKLHSLLTPRGKRLGEIV